MESKALVPGAKLKEVATRDTTYVNCTVLSSDTVGLAFEVQRTVTEGGDVETVVSQVLVPWTNINYVLLREHTT
jgi:hypothetical protein